ncbi:MAG TPA: endonuclease/exonuclease/phosphatase family protein [Streptosporangiaceae bacterium]|jgi:endonuclease/exonuclease/phosphatase family metal-dependent hydrolase
MPKQEAQGGLRTLHWNIHGWRDAAGLPNAQAVIELVRSTQPDAVSLVEVDEPWGLPSTLGAVAQECGYSWLFGPSFEYGDEQSGGGFGNALLVQGPVTAVQQWRVYTPPGDYDGSEASEPRSVILARLGLNGTSYWLGSTHFPRADATARQVAARRLQQLTDRLDDPWLICGDFNASPASCFGDHTRLQVSPDPLQPTYPVEHPAEAIDYCLAAAGSSISASVLKVPGSDHLPLLVAVRTG